MIHLRARQYVLLEAESFGDAKTAEVPHLWLSGDSELAYFVPDLRARQVQSISVSLHVSAELPGVDESPELERTSTLQILLDELAVGEVVAPVDDAHGARIELTTDDAAVLARLHRTGGHRLSIRARDASRSRGIAMYGDVILTVR